VQHFDAGLLLLRRQPGLVFRPLRLELLANLLHVLLVFAALPVAPLGHLGFLLRHQVLALNVKVGHSSLHVQLLPLEFLPLVLELLGLPADLGLVLSGHAVDLLSELLGLLRHALPLLHHLLLGLRPEVLHHRLRLRLLLREPPALPLEALLLLGHGRFVLRHGPLGLQVKGLHLPLRLVPFRLQARALRPQLRQVLLHPRLLFLHLELTLQAELLHLLAGLLLLHDLLPGGRLHALDLFSGRLLLLGHLSLQIALVLQVAVDNLLHVVFQALLLDLDPALLLLDSELFLLHLLQTLRVLLQYLDNKGDHIVLSSRAESYSHGDVIVVGNLPGGSRRQHGGHTGDFGVVVLRHGCSNHRSEILQCRPKLQT